MQNETSYRRFSKLIFNPKSEITNAILAANNFGYAYDSIGNRISATKNQEPENYSANQLNQYTQIADGVTNFPTYDLDGNMLTYNGWTFTWNGENRLIQASNSEHVISYAYDYQGRMFQKVVDGVTNTFIWDGFNIVAEISPSQTNFNVWGLDLSGSLQGAGGIGGLLSVAMPSAPCAMHFPLADGNGNITEYVDTNGTVVAHREYSAFGETLALTGTKKDDFTFWFSTKPYDPLTGISHYQKRDYWAEIGRWLSRDPIAEMAGANLYPFCLNEPISNTDPFGDIIHAECLDAWLDQYATYEKRATGSFDYFKGRKKGNDLKSLIVERLLNSTTTFTPKKEKSEADNAELHVTTRVKVVELALSLDLSREEGCRKATEDVYRAAGQLTPGSGLDIREMDEEWIPGDWGYIANKTAWREGLEVWGALYFGENIIYLGKPDTFWGWWPAGIQQKSIPEWKANIKTWKDKHGKKRGDPVLATPRTWPMSQGEFPKEVYYPTTGLDVKKGTTGP